MRFINESFVRQGAAGVTAGCLEKLSRRAGEVRRMLLRFGPLQKHKDDAGLLLALINDYRAGRYRSVPWRAISSIAFALLYVLNPLDLVPDVLPVVGQIDDALVVSICLSLVDQELKRYRSWLGAREGNHRPDPCPDPGDCRAQP